MATQMVELASGSGSKRFGRRHLLALGGGLAAAAALWPATALAASFTPNNAMGIGFIPGSDGWRSLPRSAFGVVPASSVAADASLAGRSVVVAVHGLYPGASAAKGAGLSSAWFDTVFPSAKGPASFMAWSFASSPQQKTSSPVRFVVPVDARGTPDFSIALRGASGAQQMAARLLVGTAAGPKLRQGFYLLGLRPGMWAAKATVNPAAPSASDLSLIVSVTPA